MSFEHSRTAPRTRSAAIVREAQRSAARDVGQRLARSEGAVNVMAAPRVQRRQGRAATTFDGRTCHSVGSCTIVHRKPEAG